MPRILRTLAAVSAAFVVLSAATLGVRAQDAASATPDRGSDAVLAKVGGETVTESDVALARDAFAGELANVPKPQQRSVLIDAVINMELLALAAREQGLGEGPGFEAQLEFLKLQALRNAYVEHVIVKSMTDEDLQSGYRTLIVEPFQPAQQVRARHILVDTEEVADKIIEELKGGASFEELAKQSKDPSGQNGGDLGFFGKGQMVPEFEEAAFALEPGDFTQEPVKSQFGWHVIKLEEKRMSEPPTFAEVEGQLRDYLLRQKFDTTLTALRDKYPIEIVDQSAGPEAPAEAPASSE